jgi:hypothetical protein
MWPLAGALLKERDLPVDTDGRARQGWGESDGDQSRGSGPAQRGDGPRSGHRRRGVGATKTAFGDKFDFRDVAATLEGLSGAIKSALEEAAPQKTTVELGIELAVKSGKLPACWLKGRALPQCEGVDAAYALLQGPDEVPPIDVAIDGDRSRTLALARLRAGLSADSGDAQLRHAGAAAACDLRDEALGSSTRCADAWTTWERRAVSVAGRACRIPP